jgi:hypothetical protein
MSERNFWEDGFTASDFDSCWSGNKAMTYVEVAERANKILQEQLKQVGTKYVFTTKPRQMVAINIYEILKGLKP